MKKRSGRKRRVLVDTLGVVLRVIVVHPADQQDRAGAPGLLRPLVGTLPRLELILEVILEVIWADSAYGGPLQTWVSQTLGWRLQLVERLGGREQWLRPDQVPLTRLPGFQPLPHRWIVKRTIAWIGRNQRMSRDDEFCLPPARPGST